MSVKKDMFVALSDYLITKLQFSDGVPSIQWVDKNLGQARMMQEGIMAIPLPAVLISFPTTTYQGMLGGGDQTGEAMLQIQTLFENYFDADSESPNRDAALNYFLFNERVHDAMMNFTMENVSGISRTGENEDTDHAAVIVTDLIYRFTLIDKVTDPYLYTSGTLDASIVPKIKQEFDTGFVIPEK